MPTAAACAQLLLLAVANVGFPHAGSEKAEQLRKVVTVDVQPTDKLGIAFRNADLLVIKVGNGPAHRAGVLAYDYTITAVRGIPVNNQTEVMDALGDTSIPYNMTFTQEPAADVVITSKAEPKVQNATVNVTVPKLLLLQADRVHADKAGDYVLVDGVKGNGAPTWRRTDSQYWIYFAHNKRWTIEGSQGIKNGEDFNTDRGWITSSKSSTPDSLPHQVPMWLHWNGDQWVKSGSQINITVPPPTSAPKSGIARLVYNVKKRDLVEVPDIHDLDNYLVDLEAQRKNSNATEAHADLKYIQRRLKEGLLPRSLLLELAQQQRTAKARNADYTMVGTRESAVM